MAVITLKSTQLTEGARNYPIDHLGKLRLAYFDAVNDTGAAGDANSYVHLCNIPYGRIRILPRLAFLATSAFGAARTLDVGFLAYTDSDGAAVAEQIDALIDGADVAAAGSKAFTDVAVSGKWDIFSKRGVTIAAKVLGGTIPVNATIKGYIPFVAE